MCFRIDKTKFCLKCSRSAETASSLCARLLAFAKMENGKWKIVVPAAQFLSWVTILLPVPSDHSSPKLGEVA